MDGINFCVEGWLFSASPDNHGNPEEDSEFPLRTVLVVQKHNISSQDQSNCQNFVFLLQCNFTFSMHV